ncbi:MAG: hypothetical protein KF892_23615 [Rhizobacter sp.]|nr:hypothetical protein [Rhizobacter sp.]
MQKIHQWLVKIGRLAISSDAGAVLLEVDSEGALACLLTPQDAYEVAEILALHARAIWESGTQANEYKASYEAISTSAYRWEMTSGELLISVVPEQAALSISCTAENPCHLTVGQAVEIVQVIQQLLGQLSKPSASQVPSSPKQPPSTAAKKPWWKI